MGLCIEYVVKLKSRGQVAPLIAAALKDAKKRGWKTRRRKQDDPSVTFSPHAKCEDVALDFTGGLVTDGIVKTNYAPIKTHVAVVEFFDAIKPLCASVKLDDETGYAKKRDMKALKAARDEFDDALSGGDDGEGSAPVIYTALAVSSDGTVIELDKMKGQLTPAWLKKVNIIAKSKKRK